EAHVLDSAYNAHYDRPAVLSLVGEVRGLRVLDAGCGPGLYAEELVTRGAEVVAVDAARAMVELAARRLGATATVLCADLSEPLPSLCAAVADAGFLIERVVEPVPAESMRERWPDDWEKLQREPGFLVLRLLKRH